jgi:hypothetical protein
MFREPTFWIRDSVTDAIYAFSHRGSYFDWGWGSSLVSPSANTLQTVLTLALNEGQSRYGVPFSFIYHDQCPSALELNQESLADGMVSALNSISRSSAIRRSPGVDMLFQMSDGSAFHPNGKVLAHSTVVRIKDQVFDFTNGTPPGVFVDGVEGTAVAVAPMSFMSMSNLVPPKPTAMVKAAASPFVWIGNKFKQAWNWFTGLWG